MMRISAILMMVAMLLGSITAIGQTTNFYTETALQPNPFGSIVGLLPMSFGQVRVCTFSASPAKPCTPVASITDINGVPLTIVGGNFGQLTADVLGRFTFGCTAGNTYTLQVQATTSNTPAVNHPFTCPASSTLTNVLTTNNIFSGTNSFSNTTTMAAASIAAAFNLSNVFIIDGTHYAKSDVGLQAAINDASSAGGGVVLHTSGNIAMTTGVSVPSKVHVVCVGWGPTITPSSAVGTVFSLGNASTPVTDASVDGCNLVGPNATVSGVVADTAFLLDGSRLAIRGNKATGFADDISNDNVTGSTDVEISGNFFQTSPSEGILGLWIDGRILNNRIDAVGTTNQHHGIYIAGGTRVLVAHNQISNVSGFCVQANEGTALRVQEEITIADNQCVNGGQFVGAASGGIVVDTVFANSPCRKIVVANNTIENVGGSDGIFLDSCTDWQITGNVIRTLNGAEGIRVVAATSPNTQGIISKNVIDTSTPATGKNGIHIGITGTVNNILVADNVINSIAQVAIYMDGVSDSVVKGNIINNCDTIVGGGNPCILLFHASPRIQVIANRMTNATPASGGIQIGDAGSTDAMLMGNNLIGTGGISDSGVRTVNLGNKLDAVATGAPVLNANFSGGVFTDGAAFKHKRFVGGICSTIATAGASCTTTLNWTTTFLDASYTPVCTAQGPSGNPIFAISSFSAASVVIQINAATANVSSFASIDCHAVHDF